MRVIWNSLGLYINRNLRMGRGVNVPKFGIFTLSPPEVVLKVDFKIYSRVLQMKAIEIKNQEIQYFSFRKILSKD